MIRRIESWGLLGSVSTGRAIGHQGYKEASRLFDHTVDAYGEGCNVE